MSSDIHVGDIGTALRITVEDGSAIFSLSAATISIILVKPDGTKLTKVGSLVTDGSDGNVQYVTVAGDLDQSGYWQIQAIIVQGTNEWSTEISKFRVKGNL